MKSKITPKQIEKLSREHAEMPHPYTGIMQLFRIVKELTERIQKLEAHSERLGG